jgi:hydrophobic/amphiphilic exporter-1 (mainly G- bacteria), HAE1 family
VTPIRTFIRRPIFTSMLLLALVVFGLYAYPRIGVDQFPEVEFPVVTIVTVLPGADPETVEENVSKPLEEALNTLPGIETLRSVNYESVSQVVVQFQLEVPVDVAAQDVRDRVQATISKLPPEVETPVVSKLDFGSMPVVTLALSGPLPVRELTRVAEDDVKPALQKIIGVGSIDVVGGQEREIAIEVDPVRLRAHGLAASDLAQAIRAQSVSMPGGRTTEPGRERVVKLETEAQSVDELRDLVVASPRGVPVRVRDVANVLDGAAEARSSARLDGRPAVALVIRKQSGSNTVEVAEKIRAELATIPLPAGAAIDVVADNSRFIRASIEGVQHDLVIGAILAVLVVLVFLRDWRATLVSAVALPTSIVGTFAVMKALGFTFNVITMLALTLSIGLLIDDAIVVIENVVRHLEKGEKPRRAAEAGTTQIALAVLAVTLSVIAVFVPVAFMDGMMGRFFFQFGVTVAVAVAISYAVSMTLIPTFSARILAHHHADAGGRVGRTLEAGFRWMERTYARVLRWALDHRAATVGAAVALLVATVLLARLLQFTFIPAQDMSTFKVALEMPLGTPLAVTDLEAERLAAELRAAPGVTSVYAQVGGGVDEAVHTAELIVNLLPISGRSFDQTEMKAWVRENLVPPAGGKLAALDIAMAGGGAVRSQQVQFNLRGDDWEAVLAAVEKTRAAMAKNPGLVDVDSTYRAGKPMVSVQVERDRAASLGIPAAAIGSTIRAFLGGDAVATYREKGDQIDVKLRLPEAVRADPDALGALTLRAPSGQLVEVRSVARLAAGEGPAQIDRQALKRQVTMLADLKDYSLGEALAFLGDFAAKEIPPSVQTSFEGQGKELARSGVAFLSALLLGIVLVYMILAAQFESLVHPFTIMLALPLAVIGAIGGLLLANEYMSMFAMIGMIMLAGLVTKNGILLVDYANQLKAAGRRTREALLEAGPVRMRPILMTTIAMVAGMIPVALARGDGAETRTGMAWAIIGGLVASTVLTLVVVPVVYSLVDGLRARFVRAAPADEDEEDGLDAAA